MVDSDVKSLGIQVEQFDKRVNNLNPQGDVYQNEREIKELESILSKLNTKIEECDGDIQDSSNQSNRKPLLNKLSQYKSDLEIAKNKLNEKKNTWKNAKNIELLKEGKLTGSDKIKTERDMLMGQHKETDYQGEIIDSIASNIKGANTNLVGINTELKNQGEQMNRIQDHALNAEAEVKQTEKIMTKMERRQKCMKIIGGLAVVVFGIFDVFWLIFFIIKHFTKNNK